jgi:hypothetical protein
MYEKLRRYFTDETAMVVAAFAPIFILIGLLWLAVRL